MVKFKRRAEFKSFAEVSAALPDLYDSMGGLNFGRNFSVGGNARAQIDSLGFSSVKGGANISKLLFKSKIADLPPFGAGERVGAEAHFYVNDIFLEQGSTNTPSLVMYKMKQGAADFNSSGALTFPAGENNATNRQHKGHVTAISANMNDFISDEEKFTGESSKYGYMSDTMYFPMARSIVARHKPYIEVEDAYEFGVIFSLTKGRKSHGMTRKEIRRRHGKAISGDIGQGVARTVIYLSGSGTDSIGGFNGNDYYVCHLNDSYLPRYNLFVPKGAVQNKIKGVSETVLGSSKDYNNQITPGNSFFHTVKQDREMLLTGEEGDSPTLIGTAITRFSTDKTLRGNGQSMQMYAYWAGQVSETGSGSIEGTTDADMYRPVLGDAAIPTLSSNAQYPIQETFASYGPVPFPADIFPSYYGDIPMTRVTGLKLDKSADDVVKASHGIASGSKIIFPANSGIFPEAAGVLEENRAYYVSSTGIAGGTFRLSNFVDGADVIDFSGMSGDTDSDVVCYAYQSSDTTYHHDYNTYSNGTLEIDLCFDNLEAAQLYRDGDGSTTDKISVVKRAFVITLGYYKPSAGETLLQYLDKHSGFVNKNNQDLYLADAASSTGSILDDQAPILGWSFIKTVGSTDNWSDGIHMIDMDLWRFNDDSETSGIGNVDLYIEEGTGSTYSDKLGAGAVTSSLPSGDYFTFKVQFGNTQTGDPDRIEYGLFDAKTEMPLPKSDFMENSVSTEDVDIDGNTHHIGTFYRVNAPWDGRNTVDATDGLQFWRNNTDQYFEANDSDNVYDDKGGGPQFKRAVWPRYLTLWLTNMNNRCSETVKDAFLENDGGETTVDSDVIRRPTTSSVFVDGIRLRNFNYSHSNATIPVEGGWNPNELIIQSPQGNTAFHEFAESHADVKLPGYSFLLFGTDTATDIDPSDGKDSGLLLHNFKTDLSNNQRLMDSFCFYTTNYMSAAFPSSGDLFDDAASPPVSGAVGAEFFYGGQCRVHTQGGAAGHLSESTVYGQPLQNPSNSHAVVLGDEDTSPTGSIDFFTQKGFINFKGKQLTGTSSTPNSLTAVANLTGGSTYPSVAKREMAMASARVLRNVGGGVFKVDTIAPFMHGFEDTYIAYLYGASYRETAAEPDFLNAQESGDGYTTASNIKLIEILDNKHIKLEWNGKSNLGAPMATEMQLPYLMISPKKYWFGVRVKNWQETIIDTGSAQGQISYKAFPTKVYSSANFVREQSGSDSFPDKPVQNHYGVLGATFNEYLFSDSPTIRGAYENAWKHSIEEEESIIDNSDFGYGAFTDDQDEGGYISKLNPKTNSNNIFKMKKIFDTGDVPELGEEVGFILDSQDPVSKHEVIVRNTTIAKPSSDSVPSNYVTGEGANNEGVSVSTGAAMVGQDTYGIPQLFTVFEDKLPDRPEFSVQPSEEDPFLPEFKWSAGDDDLWYGLIMIDKEPVNSQYHGAILHLPLNDDGIDMRAPSTVAHNGLVTETFSLDVSTEIFSGNTTFLKKGTPAVIYNLTNATLSGAEGKIHYVSETSLDAGSSGTFRLTTSPDGSSIGDISFTGSNDTAVKVTFGLPFKNLAYKNNSDTNTNVSAYANMIGNESDDEGELPKCNFEGLAGNCFFFDGTDNHISYDPPANNTLSDLTSEATFIAHITPHENLTGSTNFIWSSNTTTCFLNSSGIVTARVYVSASNYVELKSSAIPMDGVTPSAVIVTVDTSLKTGNVKLFINGHLNDETGPRLNAGPGTGGDNWDTSDAGVPVDIYVGTGSFKVGNSTNSFHGNIEEVVIYNKCIYPVAPKDESFVLKKPLQEISNSSPISYTARLFIKDYHNIRGGSTNEVAASPSVSYRKAAFRLGD